MSCCRFPTSTPSSCAGCWSCVNHPAFGTAASRWTSVACTWRAASSSRHIPIPSADPMSHSSVRPACPSRSPLVTPRSLPTSWSRSSRRPIGRARCSASSPTGCPRAPGSCGWWIRSAAWPVCIAPTAPRQSSPPNRRFRAKTSCPASPARSRLFSRSQTLSLFCQKKRAPACHPERSARNARVAKDLLEALEPSGSKRRSPGMSWKPIVVGVDVSPEAADAAVFAVAAAQRAELVVLGGKHHSTLGRWLGGSTSVAVVRTAAVPVLVTVGAPAIRRVLLAVDPSAAAQPAIAAAERYAALFGARLRALSVVEPPAVLPEVPLQDTTDHYRRWEETLARDVWPLIRAPGVDTLVRYGTALQTILSEAVAWSADLVVVATHGKGPVTRMLVGSVTEGLINHLPTSLLVVPAGGCGAGAALVEPDATELITVKHEEET